MLDLGSIGHRPGHLVHKRVSLLDQRVFLLGDRVFDAGLDVGFLTERAGVIAITITPGDDPGGFIITAIIGIVGALLGGFIAGAIFDADPVDELFDISTWLTSIVGAIVLL